MREAGETNGCCSMIVFFRHVAIAIIATLSLATVVFAQGREDLRVYVFGNSLVHHLSETEDDTNIAHWLDLMSSADRRGFAIDGQWGFMRNFANGLPPQPNWSFPGVRSVWNPGRQSYANAGFDSIVLTPANFIQGVSPDAPYEGDNPGKTSPLDAALKLFDWTARETPDSIYYIYEGWSDMGSVPVRYPPNARSLRRYHTFNQEAYHDWFKSFADHIASERPALELRLIPVASTIGALMGEAPLNALTTEDLYTDDAPHGTTTLYFLAAMVSYATLYQAPPPTELALPETIHPAVRENYPQLANAVWTRVQPYLDPIRGSRAAQTATAVVPNVAALPDLPRATAQEPRTENIVPEGVPALAMGLNGIADWSTQHPFIDAMKSARPWVGHLPGQWGGVTAQDLFAEGHLSPTGWPLRVPNSVTKLETFILTDQFEEAEHLRGTWEVRYKGQGTLRIGGRANKVQLSDGVGRFDYEPGEGLVAIEITDTDPSDPIRDIVVVKQDQWEMYEAGVLFNPDWIENIEDLRSVRFMDWMQTNSSTISTWDQRPVYEDYSWVEKGVPLPVMVALANQIGADPWFNIPHLADNDYVRNFATYVRDHLDPRLMAYVEYSNEVWNFIFTQAIHARDQAQELWGAGDTGWMEYYGFRSAQVMQIWSDTYGDAAEDRLVRVAATHTGWQGLEEYILTSENALEDLGAYPKEFFDAYAITGYFGYEFGGEEYAPQMQAWLDASEARARAAGEEQGLRRVALREFMRPMMYDAAIAPVAQGLKDGPLREIVEEVFPYHGQAAQAAGLDLIMYEGGTHVAGNGERVNDDRLTGFLVEFSYTPEMAELYQILLDGYRAAGGKLFNAFVDISPPSKWGSWGAKRYIGDNNLRWDALMAYNAAGDDGWQNRAPGDFTNGLRLSGTPGDDVMQGSAEEDVMLAGPGDDELRSSGGADHLHGGDGLDVAILDGALSDYVFDTTAHGITATRGTVTVTMADVELLGFTDEPDLRIDTGMLRQ